MIGEPLAIGPVRLATNLLLAPIAGYCDLAFRLTCREFGGVGLACTDLLSPHGLLRGSAASLDLARTNERDQPLGMQLYGGDPEIMAEGARWAADHGAAVVDINMGCPVDKVTKKDGGSRLMVPDEGAAPSTCRSFSLAMRITEAVRGALPANVPLTAKMRLGWSCDDDAPRLACALLDAGVQGVTVHGRTTEQRFRGSADWKGIASVVEAVRDKSSLWPGGPIPVIGNGDVRTAGDCLELIRASGCAGVMIGRAALERPWIFRDCWAKQTVGQALAPPGEDEILTMIGAFFDRMIEFRGEAYALHQIRSRISWLSKPLVSPGRPSVKALREAVRLAPDAASVREAVAALSSPSPRLTLRTDAHSGFWREGQRGTLTRLGLSAESPRSWE
ncbi:MAG: tRNA-dihydrouridine synthase family protein [Phycisphaeraceae bacterium]|nr:tRNA-dihydrouridine synthase family protein [Phycisphaeraceae bacterium]